MKEADKYVEVPEGIEYHCIVCDKHIKMDPRIRVTSHGQSIIDPCIILDTTGNWGSQVHDMNNRIHLVICDSCFVKKSKNCIEQLPDGTVQQANIGFNKWKEYILTTEDSSYRTRVLSYFKD